MLTGTCILVEGILQQPSLQGKNVIELKAEKILHVGIVDHAKYPLSKKRIPLDSLRDHAHFRPRTTTVIFQRSCLPVQFVFFFLSLEL